MKLFKLDVELESVIIGERIKGGIYRPCLETLPSSTIKGAFKQALGIEVKGVGIFRPGTYKFSEILYSIQDRYLEISKFPIISSCLYPCEDKIIAEVYISSENLVNKDDFSSLRFTIGALKSKGFGKARVVNISEINPTIKQGILNIRVLENDCDALRIESISPIYGYLFYPDNPVYGSYKKSLFEGSLVKAPEIFLKEVTYYDE